jgi:hypothetical protein
MRKYVEKFEQYSAPGSQITEEEIESLRQEIKRELGDILGSIQIS